MEGEASASSSSNQVEPKPSTEPAVAEPSQAPAATDSSVKPEQVAGQTGPPLLATGMPLALPGMPPGFSHLHAGLPAGFPVALPPGLDLGLYMSAGMPMVPHHAPPLDSAEQAAIEAVAAMEGAQMQGVVFKTTANGGHWSASIQKDGQRQSAMFPVNLHGFEGAKRLAMDWRQQREAVLGLRPKPTAAHKSEVKGVTYSAKGEWVARWEQVVGDKVCRRNRVFTVMAHGFEEAKKQAEDFRTQWLADEAAQAEIAQAKELRRQHRQQEHRLSATQRIQNFADAGAMGALLPPTQTARLASPGSGLTEAQLAMVQQLASQHLAANPLAPHTGAGGAGGVGITLPPLSEFDLQTGPV